MHNIHTYVYTYIHTYICIYIHIYICVYIYTYYIIFIAIFGVYIYKYGTTNKHGFQIYWAPWGCHLKSRGPCDVVCAPAAVVFPTWMTILGTILVGVPPYMSRKSTWGNSQNGDSQNHRFQYEKWSSDSSGLILDGLAVRPFWETPTCMRFTFDLLRITYKWEYRTWCRCCVVNHLAQLGQQLKEWKEIRFCPTPRVQSCKPHKRIPCDVCSKFWISRHLLFTSSAIAVCVWVKISKNLAQLRSTQPVLVQLRWAVRPPCSSTPVDGSISMHISATSRATRWLPQRSLETWRDGTSPNSRVSPKMAFWIWEVQTPGSKDTFLRDLAHWQQVLWRKPGLWGKKTCGFLGDVEVLQPFWPVQEHITRGWTERF